MQQPETLFKRISRKVFFHVVYAGALAEKQQPCKLVEFFERLCRKRSDVMCHIFSEGAYFGVLLQKETE